MVRNKEPAEEGAPIKYTPVDEDFKKAPTEPITTVSWRKHVEGGGVETGNLPSISGDLKPLKEQGSPKYGDDAPTGTHRGR